MKTFLLLFLLWLLPACTYETAEQETPEMTSSGGATGSILPGSQQAVVFQPAPFGVEGNYTVQFKVRDPNIAANLNFADVIRPRAHITWTVGGNPVSRFVDVGDGVSVTGTAEAVNVKVYDASTIAAPPLSAPLPYEVTVTLGKGVRSAVQQPPTYALPLTQCAPGTGTFFQVPQEAGVISVYVAVAPHTLGGAIGAYQVTVQQYSQGSLPLKTYDPRQSDWVPLIPGTQSIRVVTDPALTTDVDVQVTFGIDG